MKEEVILKTDNFNTIWDLCKDVQRDSTMVGLIGFSGAGKTSGLEYYTKENENVIYTWVRRSMTTREFYINLLNAVGYQMRTRRELTIYTIMNMIALRVNNVYKSKKLLIIDEAGKFKPQQLEYIHELRDLTKHHLGIILSGPGYFYKNLMKWSNHNVVGIPELEGRIASYVWLERPTKKEIMGFCKFYGIQDEKVIRYRFYGIDNFRNLMHEIRSYHKWD